MRINIRREMMGHSMLPTNYRRVEYIYNPSTAYIDTGFRAEGGCKMEITARVTSTNFILAGSHNPKDYPQNGYNRNQIMDDVTENYFSFNKCNSFSNKTMKIDYERHVFVMDNVGWNHKGIIDGVTYLDEQTNDVLHPMNNIVLFLGQYENTYEQNSRIYRLKIWDKDYTMVRDMVPCADNGGVVGMYDMVEGKFYHSMTSVELSGGAGCRMIALHALTAERRAA